MGNAAYQGGNFYGTGKARVMYFDSVADAKATPNLFVIADAVYVNGAGLFAADPLSTALDDGVTAFKVTAVANGRFVFDQYGTAQYHVFAPSGTSDDFARLQVVANSLIGSGRTIYFAPGTYRITTEARIQPGWPKMRATSACRFIANQTIVPTAPTPACFFKNTVFSATNTTVSTTAEMGSITLIVASITVPVIGVGAFIELYSVSNDAFYTDYRVVAISGVGPFTLTLDRRLPSKVPSGTNVRVNLSLSIDWEFDGGGCTFSGVTNRYFSISRSWNCVLKNIRFDDVDGVSGHLISYDNCGYQNAVRNCVFTSLVGGSPNYGGFICETNQQTVFENCYVGGTGAGSNITIDSGIDCSAIQCSAHVANLSCEQSPIAYGNKFSFGTYDIVTVTGSTLVQRIEDSTFENLTINAQNVDGSGGFSLNVPTRRTKISNCRFSMRPTRTFAIYIAANATEMVIERCSATANLVVLVGLPEADKNTFLTAAYASVSQVTMRDCSITDCEVLLATTTGSLDLNMIDCFYDLTKIGSGAIGAFRYAAPASITLERVTGVVAGGAYAAIGQVSTVTVKVQDSNLAGAWYTVSGTCTGYKRGQTTLTTTGGTWTTTAW